MSDALSIKQYDDWIGDIYDAWYPELHDEQHGPFRPMHQLAESHFPRGKKGSRTATILDAACGTGNNYVSFARRGYAIYGTDGSKKMLARAMANCRAAGVSTERLVNEPINGTDRAAYARHFLDRDIRFDMILLNSNSLCHLPATMGCMDVALGNLHDLLAPSGFLIVDTKRFAAASRVEGVQMFHELRYVEGEWKERGERSDGPRILPYRGEATLHSRMRYDVDPEYRVCRAFVEVTIESVLQPIERRELSYYPLPVDMLEQWLLAAGRFKIERHVARSEPLNWAYDIVEAQKLD